MNNTILTSSLEQELEQFKKDFSILIVDDNEDNRFTLRHRLKREGYQKLYEAANGKSALEIIQQQKIDLVLLDIMMPVMDGHETLEHLKQDIINQKLMVLMISADDSLDSIVVCIQNGAEDFLPKPFNVDLLRVRIRSCLEKRWAIQQQQIHHEQLEQERARYSELLHAIFPTSVVTELAETNTFKPRYYDHIAVMFVDISGFTSYCDQHSPDEILDNLQQFADICEATAEEFHIEKIKTIGDAFLATAGMLEQHTNPVLDCIKCASKIMQRTKQLPTQWQLCVGIDFGPLLAAIVGHRQYLFDIWGDTVNTAERMQGLSAPGSICLTEKAWKTVADYFPEEQLGPCKIKGKQDQQVVYVIHP
ncbi:MAG: hypothetical protein Tsb005_15410 [Gammaproteobacteria bacterium]